jgi:hypothetical protein
VPFNPPPDPSLKILPVGVDPPLQRTFKRLVNAHFSPAKIAPLSVLITFTPGSR